MFPCGQEPIHVPGSGGEYTTDMFVSVKPINRVHEK